jgi:Tol biopolymer transport system component
MAIWFPDGKPFIFTSDREDPGDLHKMPANTPGTEAVFLDQPRFRKIRMDWSPDRRHIVYIQTNPKTFLEEKS